MQLIVEGTVVSHDPSESEVIAALTESVSSPDSFVILAHDDMTYLQAAPSPDGAFEVEVQAGSLQDHWRCSDAALNLPSVSDLFVSYLKNDDGWREDHTWETMAL